MMRGITRFIQRRAAALAEVPRAPWFRLTPEDGWLTVVLVAMLVYVTVFSVQSVTPAWAPGLGILSTVTFMGLLLAFLAVEQGRLPSALVHTAALALGTFFAFAQTADAVLDGDRRSLLTHTLGWFQHALLANGGSSDNTVFLLFLAVLTMLLAYISMWLVIRTRRPWLAVLANGVVLLINLNWSTSDHYIFLALFLLAALLLLVRFTLAENMRQWRARGLRFSPDLSWDFMQAGVIFSVVVLLLAYNLPVGAANADIANALNSPNSPISLIEYRLQQLFGGVAGTNGLTGVSFFNGTLRLVGTVDLPDVAILHYKTAGAAADPTQYLITQTFDTYDGKDSWTQSLTQQALYKANQLQPAPSVHTNVDTYAITFDQTPQLGQIYLFAPGVAPASFSVPASVLNSTAANVPTTWQAQHPLAAGETYTANGYVSTATADQLRAVPFPSQLSLDARNAQFPPDLLSEYLPTNDGSIEPSVRAQALQWTKGATNMYDAAQLIEDHLRTFTYSTHNPNPPENEDAVAWFLRTQKGFCTFFASAMAEMGRALGMPTRLASGFTNGNFDSKVHGYMVKGTQAHVWTQIYFGPYGWINFEPTQTFALFNRAVASSGGPGVTPSPGTGGQVTPTPRRPTEPGFDQGPTGPGGPGGGASGLIKVGLGLGTALLLLLGLLGILLLWWRLLYRGLAPAAAALARVSRLGTWAGAPPARSQTPDEYVERLSALVPDQRAELEALSAAYDHERWGGALGSSARRVVGLYQRIQAAMMPLVVRQVRRLPLSVVRSLRRRRRTGS